MGFTADGHALATCGLGEPTRLWPLRAQGGKARDILPSEPCASLAASPARNELVVGTTGGKVLLVPIEGGPPRVLLDEGGPMVWPVAFDASGQRAVAGPFNLRGASDATLRVWDLASGRESVHSIAHLSDAARLPFLDLSFAPDGSLYGASPGGVHRLALPTEAGGAVSRETIHSPGLGSRLDLSRDGTLLVALEQYTGPNEYGELHALDRAARGSRRIATHGSRLTAVRLSPSGRVLVTGDVEGVVRVGRPSGEEPHLLLGHEGAVYALAVSPDERWIASATEGDISIWPIPDVTKPPLHALPHAELLARLDALTNLRVVRDPASATGWTLEVGPFPGWRDVPTW